MLVQQVDIINKLGLHARASSKLVELASSFVSTIIVKKKNKISNAKSLMSLMMLAANCGSIIEICCDGSDERLAMDAIVSLINNKFGEDN